MVLESPGPIGRIQYSTSSCGTERRSESRVCEVKPENDVGRRRVIHQNLPLPCNDLPFEVRQSRIYRKAKRVLKRSKSPKTPSDPSPENGSDDASDGMNE